MDAHEDRTGRLAVRLTTEEKELLERAARRGGEPVSSFVRRAALALAREVLEKRD